MTSYVCYHTTEEQLCADSKTKKKIINASFAVIFNRTCITENLLPNFTNIRLYDRAVQQSSLTQDFRKKLVEQEIERKRELLRNLYLEYSAAFDEFKNLEIEDDLRSNALKALENLAGGHKEVERARIQRKLAKLYGGNLVVPESNDCFINLSDYELKEDEKEVLNLGLNCHFLPKPSRQRKKSRD